MLSRMRIGILGLAVCLATAVASADGGAHGPLHLHKWKYVMDDRGQSWLSVQFSNESGKAVTIVGVAPNRGGPWTNVGQTVASGAMLRVAMKIVKDEPSAVWLETPQGFLNFNLPARR